MCNQHAKISLLAAFMFSLMSEIENIAVWKRMWLENLACCLPTTEQV